MSGKQLELGSLDATLKDVKLPFGLVLDRVEVSGKGLKIQEDSAKFSLKKPGTLRVVVSVKSVAAFLNLKAPAALSKFSVEIVKDTLVVSAQAKLVVSVKVKATCSLEIVKGEKLFVRLVSVGKLPEPVKKLLQGQLDQINPIFEVKMLPIKAKFDAVKLHGDYIHLDGSILGS